MKLEKIYRLLEFIGTFLLGMVAGVLMIAVLSQ